MTYVEHLHRIISALLAEKNSLQQWWLWKISRPLVNFASCY